MAVGFCKRLSDVTCDVAVSDQAEMIILTGAMWHHDEPDCRPARRWIRPCHLVVRDECVFVVVGDAPLYFPRLWCTHDELDVEFFQS
nr:hypothetical protein [Halobellus sp. ZY16]